MSRLEHTVKKQKFSKISILSLMFGIFGIAVIFIRAFFYQPWWSEYVERNVSFLAGIIGLILGLASIVRISKYKALITIILILLLLFLQLSHFLPLTIVGTLQTYRLLRSMSMLLSLVILLVLFAMPIIPKWRFNLKNQFKNGIFANSGIAAGALLIFLWWAETCMPQSTALRTVCGSNLGHFGKVIRSYSKEHNGQYPDPNQWCNLLLHYDQLEKTDFLCTEIKYRWKRQVFPWPVPKNNECYYAINPNCEPNSPQDTVLLFETNGGWNRFGGPELLTTENHRGEGCNILFNGDFVDFISSRSISKLKWK